MADANILEEDAVKADGITEEQYQLALAAGNELAKIAVVIDQLTVAHGNRSMVMMGTGSVYDSKLFRRLEHRRQELRTMLLDLG